MPSSSDSPLYAQLQMNGVLASEMARAALNLIRLNGWGSDLLLEAPLHFTTPPARDRLP
jgi:hypothetical protein